MSISFRAAQVPPPILPQGQPGPKGVQGQPGQQIGEPSPTGKPTGTDSTGTVATNTNPAAAGLPIPTDVNSENAGQKLDLMA